MQEQSSNLKSLKELSIKFKKQPFPASGILTVTSTDSIETLGAVSFWGTQDENHSSRVIS